MWKSSQRNMKIIAEKYEIIAEKYEIIAEKYEIIAEKYQIGERLEALCTSWQSHPPANLTWWINEEKVIILFVMWKYWRTKGCSIWAFLDAIASPSTYPGQWVGEWDFGDSYCIYWAFQLVSKGIAAIKHDNEWWFYFLMISGNHRMKYSPHRKLLNGGGMEIWWLYYGIIIERAIVTE